MPTMREWLSELRQQPQLTGVTPADETLSQVRVERDAELDERAAGN
jgi:hypothetical protein